MITRRVFGISAIGVALLMGFGESRNQGFVNVGPILANKLVIFGTNDGWFIYNGSPSLGNPPIAFGVSPGTSLDPYNNPLPISTGGLVTVNNLTDAVSQLINGFANFWGENPSAYTEPGAIGVGAGALHSLALQSPQIGTDNQSFAEITGGLPGSITLHPANAGSGFSALLTLLGGGNMTYVSGADGNTYDTQILHVDLPSTAITAVTPLFNTIGNAVPVAAAKYKFHIRGTYTGSAAGAGIPRFQLASPAFNAAQTFLLSQSWQNNASSVWGGDSNGALGPVQGFNPMAAGTNYFLDAWGEAVFTASGTVQFEANTSAMADNFQWNIGAMEIWPVN